MIYFKLSILETHSKLFGKLEGERGDEPEVGWLQGTCERTNCIRAFSTCLLFLPAVSAAGALRITECVLEDGSSDVSVVFVEGAIG
jgi:hypothetical protein